MTKDIAVLAAMRNSTETKPFLLKLKERSARSVSYFLQWQQEAFELCFQATKLSRSCSACYGRSGEYVFDNFEMACIMNWRGKACVDCGKVAAPAMASCVGKPEA